MLYGLAELREKSDSDMEILRYDGSSVMEVS